MSEKETYAEEIIQMLESAISFERIITGCKVVTDDYDVIQSVCGYMERIIKEIKDHPDPRTHTVSKSGE